MARRRIALFSLVMFVAFLSGGWLLQRRADAMGLYQRANLFEQVLAHVAEYYVDEVSQAELYEMAIDGMLEELNDPYTNFLRAQDFGNLQLSTTGNYGGLGIRIEVRDGAITVVTPLPDTPAERAGIQPGDRIVEVEGESAIGWTSEMAVSRLKGEAGTDVRVGIERAGYPDMLQFDITRARIHVSSVGAAVVVAPGVGYVSLSTVSETSADEVAEAVAGLRAEGVGKLIFDLRNNPGGLLDQGVRVADHFLPQGWVVVETRGRAPGQSQVYSTRRDELWSGMPVVVLVNELSASAAEIIAGALQDNDRALILGRTTFGKGVAQLVFRIGESEALRVTSARWYTPLGRSISRHEDPVDSVAAGEAEEYRTPSGRVLAGDGGIVPDVEVPRDTLTEAEQVFARVLGPNVPAFRDVVTGLAIEWRGEGVTLDTNFTVTDEMNRELLNRLRERGVEMSASDWRGARTLVDQQFSYEVARYLFDRNVEFRRRTSDDPDVQRAIELLESAATPAELFDAANR